MHPKSAERVKSRDSATRPIDGRAEFVELLGRETMIGVVTAGDLRFTVLAEPDATAKPGEQIRFGLEPGRLHLFDAETERALSIV